MTPARKTAQRAYVLHRRPYRETSAIIDFFCEHDGRIPVVVQGLHSSGRKRSTFASLCQPLQCLSLSWRGQGGLKTLVDLERATAVSAVHGERLYSLLYCNELLTRLLAHDDPHPTLFQAYQNLLESITGLQPLEPALRRFELILIDELGYGFALDRVSDSGLPLDAAAYYRFVPQQGLVETLIADSDRAYVGEELLAIASGRLDEIRIGRTAKRLTREVLRTLLGPRPLISRELFKRR